MAVEYEAPLIKHPNPLPCGCMIVGKMCPMHEAASDLKDAIEQLLRYLHGRDVAPGYTSHTNYMNAIDRVKAAIAKAEPNTEQEAGK